VPGSADVSAQSGLPSWDEVLASFEAGVDQAEALISGTPAVVDDHAPYIVSYDLQHLAMPPLPAALRPRAEAVRSRQARLADELQSAMVNVRRQAQLTVESGAAPRPVFVDRRA
jgi:hypothetical protein